MAALCKGLGTLVRIGHTVISALQYWVVEARWRRWYLPKLLIQQEPPFSVEHWRGSLGTAEGQEFGEEQKRTGILPRCDGAQEDTCKEQEMYLHWFHCTLKDPCTFPVMAPHVSPLTRTQIRSAVQCFTLSRIPSALPTPQKRSFRNTFASTLAAIRLTVTGLDSGLCNPAGWKKGKGFCARQVIQQRKLKNQRLTASNYSRCLQNRNRQSLGYSTTCSMILEPRTCDRSCHGLGL